MRKNDCTGCELLIRKKETRNVYGSLLIRQVLFCTADIREPKRIHQLAKCPINRKRS